ncbi:hypothetical protein CF392_14715 [Tamilnaduibacter salinus]|uniref:Uncharacterized protein n=1 Tax=Tamilnaduibacter salinus TaxID=1484056 RepID=A0A2A2I131_9GAMM|nr:hypothetical protein [Tamilnaduibacter salinus]PAV24723.1 hypothetical protein CF392_14715 [Tamilnaduibacter salinus]
MTEFSNRFLDSSVLRPLLIAEGLESDDRGERLIDIDNVCGGLKESIRSVLLIRDRGARHEDIERIFEERVDSDDFVAVSMIGEMFLEKPEFSQTVSKEVIDRYFDYLNSRSSMLFFFSKAKLKLNVFHEKGRESDLVEAISHFKQAKQRGNLTAAILYNRLQLALLRERRLSGSEIGYILGRVGLFLSMLFVVWDSVEDVTVNRWWRYFELAHVMPVRVKSIDDAIQSGKVNWTGTIKKFSNRR